MKTISHYFLLASSFFFAMRSSSSAREGGISPLSLRSAMHLPAYGHQLTHDGVASKCVVRPQCGHLVSVSSLKNSTSLPHAGQDLIIIFGGSTMLLAPGQCLNIPKITSSFSSRD